MWGCVACFGDEDEIESMARLEAARVEERRARALLEVIKTVQDAEANTNMLVSRLLEVGQEVLECEHVTLFFVDEGRDVLVAANPTAKVPTDIVIRSGHGIAGAVAAAKVTANVKDAYRDGRFDKSFDARTGFVTRSVLCAPVVSRERCVAVIQALNKKQKSFDREDVLVLETLARELRRPLHRASLENAWTRARTEQTATLATLLGADSVEESIFTAATTPKGGQSISSPLKETPRSAANSEELASFEFDATSLSESRLASAVAGILRADNSLDAHNVDQEKLRAFLWAVRSGYHENAYHNFEHGVAVMQSAYSIARRSSLIRTSLQPLDLFALKIASLAHDVDHPGTNNDFEIRTSSRRALLYNDVSVLENHHAAYLFSLIRRPECNVLDGLDLTSYARVRKLVVASILATDMAKHADHVRDLERAAHSRRVALNRRRSTFSFSGGDDDDLLDAATPTTNGATSLIHTPRGGGGEAKESGDIPELSAQFLVEAAVHLADLGNAAHPDFAVAKKWGYRIIDEFKAQASLEARLGLPVAPSMARLETPEQIAQSQVGFLDFVVSPLVSAAADLLPELKPLEANLASNRRNWLNLAQSTHPPNHPGLEDTEESSSSSSSPSSGCSSNTPGGGPTGPDNSAP